jgi:hypothetical protein
MRRALQFILLAALALVVVSPTVQAQPIPIGYGDTGIAEGYQDLDDEWTFDRLPDGTPGVIDYPQVGDWVNIGASQVKFELSFSPAGGDATLTMQITGFSDYGSVVDKVYSDALGKQHYTSTAQDQPPLMAPATYHLTFSGGPTGKFTETGSEQPITIYFNGLNRSSLLLYLGGSSTSLELTLLTPWDALFGSQVTPAPTKVDSGTRFNSLSGQVEVRYESESDWHSAKLDDVLYVDDHIRTYDESSCILSFADMSTFLMKAESEIVLNSPPDKDSKFWLVYGKIKANVKKMMKDGSMEIDMSQAVTAIKGTTFVLEDGGAGSVLKVLEGRVSFTSRATGETVTVGPGEMATADAAGLGPVLPFDVDTENADWADFSDDSGNTGSGVSWPDLPGSGLATATPDASSGPGMLPFFGAGLLICIYALTRNRKER